uniref:EGF-like domain-containing protein n=1 Tax=Corethron hystrix TaxID=216773 RepID=A0A7S1BE51_9STRA|mmetsp:Transcript_244/g.539  ORF Transcript_244/g.539 Transcript_244/m.539 type:complete len:635 (+) Transcript_244:101-2005(+)|eukprot:CAMPEP_0113311320 /NCGR_PEP_ID=MMETSP0010_2-20120614/8604_1 /TAXON_ID=216773 ORGANISM="Corethron hystrix, Strain 308" /NCGR_SAMPLE_ID=MMETSP0010_2 /ASSEMBLY_ACC=CAM_ASM_000155 /LENGTH=634 /DNA_ID=CAMNT_0000166935 /DNA_START=98 /DNA_END=2002 /DNA_ORIENTATION=+ /assembly_acc=CAM_ASM_000155
MTRSDEDVEISYDPRDSSPSYDNNAPSLSHDSDKRLCPEICGDRLEALKIPYDTFGMLHVVSFKHKKEFFYIVIFSILEIGFSLLIFTELLFKENKFSFGIPAGVKKEVWIAQFIALLVAVMTQKDLLKWLELMSISVSSLSSRTGVPVPQNIIALFLRFFQGMSGLLISLMIIIQSEGIVVLFSEFAGLEFISAIGNVIFSLSDRMYFGDGLAAVANKTKAIEEFPETPTLVLRRRRLCRFLQASMIAVWAVVRVKQAKGDFVQTKYSLVIGDEFRLRFSYLSGTYTKDGIGKTSKWVIYRRTEPIREKPLTSNKNSGENVRAGVIGYCAKIRMWTVANPLYDQYDPETHDPCLNQQLRSEFTDSFDLSKTSPSLWKIKSDTSGWVAAPALYQITPGDCKTDKSCTRVFNDPSGRISYGKCNKETKTCVCESGRTGLKCEIPVAPNELIYYDYTSLEEEQNTFKTLTGSNDFNILHRERPVYMQQNSTLSGSKKLILFQGVRWIIAELKTDRSFYLWKNEFWKNKDTFERDDVAMFLTYYYPILKCDFASEETRAGTPMGLAFEKVISQNGFGREFEGIGITEEQDFVFISSDCTISENKCSNGFKCVDHKCECSSEFKGSLCQIPINATNVR